MIKNRFKKKTILKAAIVLIAAFLFLFPKVKTAFLAY